MKCVLRTSFSSGFSSSARWHMAKKNIAEDSSPVPVYAVFGSDDYLRQQSVERVKAAVLGEDGDAASSGAVAEFSGDNARLADVLDECRTASLLAPLRLVMVRDADDFVSENREALEKYLQSPCPTGILLLVCKSWKSTTRLYKLVEKIGRNIPCDTPKGQALPGWVASRAQEAHGVRLDPQSARRLVELVGPQLGLLDMELGKLATFVHPRTAVRIEEVEELVGASRAEKVFVITDAVAAGDAAAALTLWDQVISTDRDAEYRAIGGLAYAFRRLAEAKRLVVQGLSPFEAAKSVGIWTDPGQLKRQLDRFSLRQWQNILVKLLSIDVGAKTGLGSVRSAVEKFIAELCAVPRPRVAGR